MLNYKKRYSTVRLSIFVETVVMNFLVEKRPMTFYIFVLTLYCLNLLQNMYEPVQKIDSDSVNICKQYHRCLKELHFMIGIVLILLLNDWQ